MKKISLLFAMFAAGVTMSAQTDNKVDVTIGDWTFAAERNIDKGISISEITTVGTSGNVDFTKAAFSNTDGENKIFNIRPRVFRNCDALTSITLPASLVSFMPIEVESFSADIEGNGSNQSAALTHPLGNADFELTATVTFADWSSTDNKSALLGEWGSAILATGDNPVADQYDDGLQLYLQNPSMSDRDGSLVIKYNGDMQTTIDGTANLINTCGGRFSVKIDYDYEARTLSVYMNGAAEPRVISDVTIGTVSRLSTNINKGVSLAAYITEPADASGLEVDNPFSGCDRLTDFEIAEGNTTFSVGSDGALRKNGEVMAYPYGRLFGRLVRFNVADENGTGTGAYITSNVHANADGTQDTGAEDGTRQFIVTNGKTGASLFEFVFFPDDTDNRKVSILDVNASYGGTEMWAGGKADNQNRWESTANRIWSGRNINMAVTPDRELVTFHISVGDYFVTINQDNGAELTIDKSEATEFAIEFAEDIDVAMTNGYATACLPVAVTAPEVEGLHVCDAEVSDGQVILKSLAKSIAARTPVIFYSEANASKVTLSIDQTATAAAAANNGTSVLKGFTCPCDELTAADSYGYDGTATNFGQTTSTPSNSAILARPADASWPETLPIATGVSTGISRVESSEPRPAVIYDLQGRRVMRPARGIYIINGTKMRLSHQ